MTKWVREQFIRNGCVGDGGARYQFKQDTLPSSTHTKALVTHPHARDIRQSDEHFVYVYIHTDV